MWIKLGIAWSAAVSWVGLTTSPDSNPERLAQIEEMYAGYAAAFPDVPALTPRELLSRQAAGEDWVIVDVRPEPERAVAMLAGAVTREQVEANPAAYAGPNVVAYCTIGYRSGLWAEEMAGRGLLVHNLAGSALAWSHVGGAFEDADGAPTQRLHVYGPLWDLARTDVEAVW